VHWKRHPPSYAYRAARLMSRRSPQPCTKYTNTMRIHPANDPKYSGIPIVRTRSAGRSPECRYIHRSPHTRDISCENLISFWRTSRGYNVYIYITLSSPQHIRSKTPIVSLVHRLVVFLLPSTVTQHYTELEYCCLGTTGR